MGRFRWWLGPALLLGACSYPDYTAIRDWAGTAADAAAWRPAPPREAPPATEAVRRDAAAALQDALDAWFTALSTLAADGRLKQFEDPLAAQARRAATFDPEAGRAVAALGGLLVEGSKGSWRAPQTADAIKAADPAVQAALRALSDAVGGLAAQDAAEREAIAALYGPLEERARDPAARQAIRDLRALREADLAARVAGRQAYLAVLARLAEGQALLMERRSHLSQEETARQVRAAEATLRRAAALLPRGLVQPTG